MLELRLAQATLLKNALEALKDLSSEAYFDFSKKGLELQARDTESLALVTIFLRPEAFSQYRCDSHLFMGLKLAEIDEVFRCIDNDDIVTIKAQDGVDWHDTITFTFESTEFGEISSFEFDFADVKGLPFKFKEYDYNAIVHMNSAEFSRICKRLSSLGKDGDVVISVYKEQLNFVTWGKSGGSSRIFCSHTLTGKPKGCTLIEMKEKASLAFDLRYINSVSKVSNLSDQVTIRLSPGIPALFEYKIPEGGYIRYCIVPRGKKKDEMQNEGDEFQRTAKEDQMQNEGDEMEN